MEARPRNAAPKVGELSKGVRLRLVSAVGGSGSEESARNSLSGHRQWEIAGSSVEGVRLVKVQMLGSGPGIREATRLYDVRKWRGAPRDFGRESTPRSSVGRRGPCGRGLLVLPRQAGHGSARVVPSRAVLSSPFSKNQSVEQTRPSRIPSRSTFSRIKSGEKGVKLGGTCPFASLGLRRAEGIGPVEHLTGPRWHVCRKNARPGRGESLNNNGSVMRKPRRLLPAEALNMGKGRYRALHKRPS